MSFIVKAVVVLLIFSFIVYVLKAISRLSFRLRGTVREVGQIRDRMLRREAVSAEMIRCEACKAFVSTQDSVQLKLRNRLVTYCSERCMRNDRVRAS